MAALSTCFVGLIAVFIAVDAADEYKLELVQVLFRHGDRYPTPLEVQTVGEDRYTPNFKNCGELNQLTATGMARAYKLGQMLRKRYGHFLGDYRPGEVYARSTNIDRTKMSLQLVLASLYPPTNHSAWSKTVPWRPVPMEYEEQQFDFLKIDHDSVCMGNGKLIAEAQNSATILQQMEDYEQMMSDVKNKTAMKAPTPHSAFLLYTYLTTILSMDLSLPDWCPPEYYVKLRKASGIFFDALTLTQHMRKMVAGSMIEEILKNAKNNEKGDKRKIYLYSAHDTNIGSFVHAHNFTELPVVPDFSSAIIVEKLRGPDKQSYFRIFYWSGVEEEMIPVKVQDCDYTCLVSDYTAAVGDMIPSEEEKSCYAKNLCVREGY